MKKRVFAGLRLSITNVVAGPALVVSVMTVRPPFNNNH